MRLTAPEDPSPWKRIPEGNALFEIYRNGRTSRFRRGQTTIAYGTCSTAQCFIVATRRPWGATLRLPVRFVGARLWVLDAPYLLEHLRLVDAHGTLLAARPEPQGSGLGPLWRRWSVRRLPGGDRPSSAELRGP